MPEGRKLLIAGGGTGGHVLAGVAIADEWMKAYGAQASVRFVGARGGIEEKILPRTSYPLRTLRIGALKGGSLLKRFRTLAQLPLSFAASAQELLRFRPDAVVGVGGYSSGPVLLMAAVLRALGLLRAHTAILEQNSVPGFTNRVLSRLVQRIFTAFPGLERRMDPKKVFFTGNPVRSQLARVAAATADPFTIFIFGGSQGAMGVNTQVLAAMAELRDLYPRIRIVHQTGDRDFVRVHDTYAKLGLLARARVERFIFDMKDCYAQASLLICRSGSSTLAELASVGRAAILIPLPTAADNHQEVNARVFSDRGAALLLKQSADGAGLASAIREMVATPARLREIEARVLEMDRPHAARDIVAGLGLA